MGWNWKTGLGAFAVILIALGVAGWYYQWPTAAKTWVFSEQNERLDVLKKSVEENQTEMKGLQQKVQSMSVPKSFGLSDADLDKIGEKFDSKIAGLHTDVISIKSELSEPNVFKSSGASDLVDSMVAQKTGDFKTQLNPLQDQVSGLQNDQLKPDPALTALSERIAALEAKVLLKNEPLTTPAAPPPQPVAKVEEPATATKNETPVQSPPPTRKASAVLIDAEMRTYYDPNDDTVYRDLGNGKRGPVPYTQYERTVVYKNGVKYFWNGAALVLDSSYSGARTWSSVCVHHRSVCQECKFGLGGHGSGKVSGGGGFRFGLFSPEGLVHIQAGGHGSAGGSAGAHTGR